jgi:single-strand DNA-binding protein
MDYSKLIIVGNLTRDAEVKQAKDSEIRYADFTVAVGRKKDETTFYPVRAFGKLGESCTILKKGDRALVEGEFEVSQYADENGERRMTYRVVANTYRKL